MKLVSAGDSSRAPPTLGTLGSLWKTCLAQDRETVSIKHFSVLGFITFLVPVNSCNPARSRKRDQGLLIVINSCMKNKEMQGKFVAILFAQRGKTSQYCTYFTVTISVT